MTNEEVLNKLFGEHDRFRYVQWLRGNSCISCKIKDFCDEYYRNRQFSDCGIATQAFLDVEIIQDGN
jgi:hypothetical protein